MLSSAQIHSTYDLLPLTLVISVVNSLLLGFVLLPVVSAPLLLGWVGLVIAQAAIRMATWVCHRQLNRTLRIAPWWAHIHTAGAMFSGTLWGAVPVLFSLDATHLLFVALIIAGMCAGAATVHAAYFPSVVGFIVPALLPLVVSFLFGGSRVHIVSGIMACVFGVSLCVASLNFRKWFNDTMSAHLDLDVVNARLMQEITNHRATEAKLQQSQRLEAVGRLTAGVAHDFNNLLMAVGGSAGLIARQVAGTDCAPYASIILEAVDRGANLTRQLLAFGLRQALMPRSVDINEVLRGLEKLLVTTLGGYGRLVWCLGPSPMITFVDASQLEHAIVSLILNAREALPEGGEVAIKTARVILNGAGDGLVGKFVRIAIADTGIGMTEEVRLKAFDPFFTTKEMGAGSGLGLSHVYGMVQQSGGVTMIDSRIGHGTTVSIYLPEGPPQAVTRSEMRSDAVAKAPKDRRIVILDDDPEVGETVAAMLNAVGYDAVFFSRANEALGEVKGSRPIDLLMVDFAMPDMRGDRFAGEARRHRNVPIVFITGYVTPLLQTERWVLSKPFSMASLIQMVERAIGGAHRT